VPLPHGRVLTLDRALNLLDYRPCLREPWHLSYPYLVEDEGEVFVLPEAYKSGRLRLYRTRRFPVEWEPAALITLDSPAIDPTVVRHGNLWWMFDAPSADLRPGREGSTSLLPSGWTAHGIAIRSTRYAAILRGPAPPARPSRSAASFT